MTPDAENPVKKTQLALRPLAFLPRALGLVFTVAPGWTLAGLLLLILRGMLPAASVALTRLLVDSLVNTIEAGGTRETILPALSYALLFGGVMALSQLLSQASEWVHAVQGELVRERVATLVHRQSILLDLAFYDSPEYYDRLYRARAEAGFRPVSLLDNFGTLLQNCVTLLALGAVLAPYGVWLPLLLLLGALPVFYVMLRHNRYQHDWYVRTTSDQRRAWYYDWLLTARAAAAELRLFRLGDHYRRAHRRLRRRLREERFLLARKRGLAELAAGLFGLLVTAGVMSWLFLRVMAGQATLGDLTLFYQAFSRGQSAMRSLLNNAGHVYAHGLFLQHFFAFLELEPQVQDPPHPQPLPTTIVEGIRFSQVTFHYPGKERAALREFDLTIPAGRVTALVGNNGAGKSTLIKLLCRLYDPQSGRIEVDGIDIRDVRTSDLQALITILFQEPVHYQDTLANNIALSNQDGQTDRLAVQQAAEDAGAHDIAVGLPKGYDNLVGNWFEGGTELSVGEWQRIALARAFLRQAPIVVLDEPTSAMDSWAEIDWLQRFRDRTRGRTVIVITHRFTTAGCADIIHVMDRGRIVESGTHDELLAQDGRYASSWRAQFGRQESPSMRF